MALQGGYIKQEGYSYKGEPPNPDGSMNTILLIINAFLAYPARAPALIWLIPASMLQFDR